MDADTPGTDALKDEGKIAGINPMLTREQVSMIFQVPAKTVDIMRRRGQLPATRIGRRYRYPAEKIRAMAEDGCIIKG